MVLATSAHAANLLDVPWKAVPASGVEMKLTHTDTLRVDFDFQGRAGYAIARRDGRIELPDNFELAFRVKGDAPRNTLEVKFVQGDNVWWSVRREYDFPSEWRRVSVKKRQLEFAWGPIGPSPLPKTIDAIELVVTAGTGGKGTVWFDDVQILPLDTAEGPPPSHSFSGETVDLGARYEIGGVVTKRPIRSIATSIDGKTWEIRTFDRAATWIPLFDTDARYIRADAPLQVLPPLRDDNAFFTEVAKHHRRGIFPRYLLGEQSYWTIVGGTNGEEEEALFSEDGAVEAGHARFSIEPFLLLDGKLVTWNDVAIEQREGPQVVWKKHLTITPRYEDGTLKVRYETAPNAKLLLAIRPFQVNPQWQFLNRTGGVARIRAIDDDLTVHADATKRLAVGGWRLAEELLPEASVAGEYESRMLSFESNDVTIEIPLGEALSTQHSALSTFSLEVPAEPRIAKSIEAQVRYILLNRDDKAIHPGSRSYERSWIRDGSLTSDALLRLGRYDIVREYIEWYAKFIRENGYVPCCVSPAGGDPVPEHDSHGQFIYLVAEYYRHTNDRALVERMLPTIRRIVEFIDELRHQRMTKQYENTAFYGMAPESISHEGYSAKPMHSYWDDLFILKGLEDAAFLAREVASSRLPVPRGAAPGPNTTGNWPLATGHSYAQLAQEFRTHLLASIERTMKQHDIDYIPGSVELGDFDATSTTVAVTPVDADLPRTPLLRTFEKYWEHALEPRTYTPYELRVVGTLVRLGQPERARALLDSFFEDQRPAAWHQWAEVVRANPREGAFIGDMPHTWVGSDFIRSALDLFAYEDDDALVLAAGIAPEWAKRGVRVRGLSTHFGVLDYSITDNRMHIGGNVRIPKNGIVVISPCDGRRIVVRDVPADITLSEGRGQSAEGRK
ncbi:MAG: amylo-alpha-1,6-glucosidase [Thermoanaerobaculia bacterium]